MHLPFINSQPLGRAALPALFYSASVRDIVMMTGACPSPLIVWISGRGLYNFLL